MYFAIDTATGGKYGPVDVATLRQWMAEGRVTNAMMFEDANSGAKLSANQVPGLMQQTTAPSEPQQSPYQPIQQPYAQYPAMQSEETQKDVVWAFVFAGLSLICCPLIFGILGIIRSNKLISVGHPSGKAALITNIATMVLSLVISALTISRGIGG